MTHPQPNRPLTAEDVGLLKRGDVLRVITPSIADRFGPIVRFERVTKGIIRAEGLDHHYAHFAFVERPVAARPALSAGGGDIRTLRVLLDNLVIAQSLSREIRQQTTDEARAYLYNTRAALAPREEAPAEAGEKDRRIADLLEANNRYLARARAAEAELAALRARSSEPVGEDGYKLSLSITEGLWTNSLVVERPPSEDLTTFQRTLSLRLSKSWTVRMMRDGEAVVLTPRSTTLPTPDNLRVAREALEKARGALIEIHDIAVVDDNAYRNEATIHNVNGKADWSVDEINEALAALNAEGL